METESLHARPQPGKTVLPCCGRTLAELPPFDRIGLKSEQVTCGRLSVADELLLTGHPVVLDPANEQVLYNMASTVCSLCAGTVTLQRAYDKVNDAMREILPRDRPLVAWSASLMVRVTARAHELTAQ